jgi:hypothetical protein
MIHDPTSYQRPNNKDLGQNFTRAIRKLKCEKGQFSNLYGTSDEFEPNVKK